MTQYHFDKAFITAHTLTDQLAKLKVMLDKRDKAWKQQWADTVPPDQAFDDDDLDEIRKFENIRDKK
jgi:hypothetical protein